MNFESADLGYVIEKANFKNLPRISGNSKDFVPWEYGMKAFVRAGQIVSEGKTGTPGTDLIEYVDTIPENFIEIKPFECVFRKPTKILSLGKPVIHYSDVPQIKKYIACKDDVFINNTCFSDHAFRPVKIPSNIEEIIGINAIIHYNKKITIHLDSKAKLTPEQWRSFGMVPYSSNPSSSACYESVNGIKVPFKTIEECKKHGVDTDVLNYSDGEFYVPRFTLSEKCPKEFEKFPKNVKITYSQFGVNEYNKFKIEDLDAFEKFPAEMNLCHDGFTFDRIKPYKLNRDIECKEHIVKHDGKDIVLLSDPLLNKYLRGEFKPKDIYEGGKSVGEKGYYRSSLEKLPLRTEHVQRVKKEKALVEKEAGEKMPKEWHSWNDLQKGEYKDYIARKKEGWQDWKETVELFSFTPSQECKVKKWVKDKKGSSSHPKGSFNHPVFTWEDLITENVMEDIFPQWNKVALTLLNSGPAQSAVLIRNL